MRWLAVLPLVLLCVPVSPAQHQEPSLADRLLRPKMDLQNTSQNKRFPTSSAFVETPRKPFCFQVSGAKKSFSNSPNYSTTEYHSRPFDSGPRVSAATQNQTINTGAPVRAVSIRDVHAVYDANAMVATRDFADQRQLTVQGKSQKSLDRQNPPMTIDQVRELLNKNK